MSYTKESIFPVWINPRAGEYPADTIAAWQTPYRQLFAAERARLMGSAALQRSRLYERPFHSTPVSLLSLA